jgi:hypothetical protein
MLSPFQPLRRTHKHLFRPPSMIAVVMLTDISLMSSSVKYKLTKYTLLKINLEGKYSPLVPFWINFWLCTIIFPTPAQQQEKKWYLTKQHKQCMKQKEIELRLYMT